MCSDSSGDAAMTIDGLDEGTARRLLASSSRIQYHVGLSDYLGHSSVRLPGSDRVVIKPKHSPAIRGMDTVAPEHMTVIDLDGTHLAGDHRAPAELWIHTEIYRAREDVGAVVHTHQPRATLMGILGAPIHPVLHVQSPLVAEPVPLWPCSLLVTSRDLGQDLAKALGGHAVAHLQGHGIVSVAPTLQEATVGAIHLEQLATANLEILKTGLQPRVVPPDEIDQLSKDLASVAGRWAYYGTSAGADLVTEVSQ